MADIADAAAAALARTRISEPSEHTESESAPETKQQPAVQQQQKQSAMVVAAAAVTIVESVKTAGGFAVPAPRQPKVATLMVSKISIFTLP